MIIDLLFVFLDIPVELYSSSTNLDSSPRSEPALELNSRAASIVGCMSPFPWSQHRKQFWRRADNSKKKTEFF